MRVVKKACVSISDSSLLRSGLLPHTHTHTPFICSTQSHLSSILKPPLLQPHAHPLLPHRCQISHGPARLHRQLGLEPGFVLGPTVTHGRVEIQQFDTRVLGHVIGAQGRRGLESREPRGEGDGCDDTVAVLGVGLAGGSEVPGHCWDECVPGTRGGVYEVVVVQI